MREVNDRALSTYSASVVDVKSVVQGWINVSRVELRMPDGAIVERHIEDHGPGVAVLPYDPHRKMAMLISQPRAPVLLSGHVELLETMAGRLDGMTPENRVREEALEEGGIRLDILELVVHLWSMPSISTERLHLYLAPYDQDSLIGSGGGCEREHENIRVHEIPLSELGSKAVSGRITDAKTLILLLALQARQPDLF